LEGYKLLGVVEPRTDHDQATQAIIRSQPYVGVYPVHPHVDVLPPQEISPHEALPLFLPLLEKPADRCGREPRLFYRRTPQWRARNLSRSPCKSNSGETSEAVGDRRAYGGRMELLPVVCWSGIWGLGSIEIGSLGPLKTLPLDHTSGSPESLLGLLPYINKLPLQRVPVKLNHNIVSALAVAHEVFSEEKHASIVRVAQ
jgi:hypothetical protein